MKKIVNHPADMVDELLEGFSLAFPNEVILTSERIVVRRKPKAAGKVALVTLGGSGHEPALSGFVGTGLLDASVPGEIFAAPGPQRCVQAMEQVDTGAGILLIVLNHAGDVLTSNLAMEMAREKGLDIRLVLVHDDIASGSKDRKNERRGLVGILPVIKIAGAAAEQGLSLDKVTELANQVQNDTRTLSVGFSGATHPVTGLKSVEIAENTMIVGVGQHGEKSGEIMDITSADELVDMMLARLVDDLDGRKGDRLLVVLNGAGATTLMELYIVFRRLHKNLSGQEIEVSRSQIGEFITSQEQAGFQVNLTRLDDRLLGLWDAPCGAPFFRI